MTIDKDTNETSDSQITSEHNPLFGNLQLT